MDKQNKKCRARGFGYGSGTAAGKIESAPNTTYRQIEFAHKCFYFMATVIIVCGIFMAAEWQEARLDVATAPPAKVLPRHFKAVVMQETALRNGPSPLAKRMITVAPGQTVEVTATFGDWHQARYAGKEGWLPIDSSFKE